MADTMDFFSIYVMGSIQMLLGFYFYVRLLHKNIKFYYYILFLICGVVVIHLAPAGMIAGFGAFVCLLTASGILLCQGEWKPAVLYAALVVEIIQLCYGIVNPLSSIFYPWMSGFDQNTIGIIFMLSGNVVSLLLAGFCCHMACCYFSYYEEIQKRYVFLVLIPVLMIFIVEEYINSVIYGMVDTDGGEVTVYKNHYQMLIIQLLGMTSLFCILFVYKKMIQNFYLNTELLLLEQEEHSLNQYVEEAKSHYEKTKSFRHDIRNHITVVRKLLQSDRTQEALRYIGDMEKIAEELSFPCNTNNPVVDILAGNKLGIAQSMGIDVSCSLILPYPCGLRDIDICIILSNALDNAIHACRDMDDKAEKYIHVAGRIQGDFLFIEIENSFQGKGLCKKGTGLSNIKMITEKYHGTMSVKAQGKIFILHVLLIIPQHSESIPRQMDSVVFLRDRKG